ncbi:uncharacterized protein J4E92_009534 [Alternaria infectoria]|uniref:uncharacterized protein n=1 Tax=Alternaria infectoria TaxID=45303 RepID=UPI002220484A|nr:uncharacterized protein J4E92_009534 [Alternaria infectoria]KAI4914335.1 hypothetical protein J4E92_009534 [Alternaria infectoria]
MTPEQEKQAQAQYEENLKAAIISHARVIFGLEDSLTDVVSSEVPQGFVSHVIHYPKIKSYRGGFKRLLSSKTCSGVSETYENLLQFLRSRMAEYLGN